MDFSKDEEDEFLATLVSDGFLELIFDEKGEALFSPTEKCKVEFPELYTAVMQAHVEEIDEALNDLVLAGLVEVNGVNDDGEITYGLTELGKTVAEAQKNV